MNKGTKIKLGCAALVLVVSAIFFNRTVKTHKVVYVVHGPAASEYVNISYLDTVRYGIWQSKDKNVSLFRQLLYGGQP
jgi:hypothetical protein